MTAATLSASHVHYPTANAHVPAAASYAKVPAATLSASHVHCPTANTYVPAAHASSSHVPVVAANACSSNSCACC